ncbi:hypothetical protein M413DRAFT_247139 [Hebeloma cylindrosporum]|uniref:Uncharacterized protein n=1 Tax=Hebeloma cylindrosporum TaxID=76867 RepID=A0A0C3C1R4_HEBCY|nr:hypothetical protein M413DRAFT_247139 [Hebeloma cylindrosporum h7]
MNNFSASIVLCEMSLQEFVDMSSDERMNGFGGYVGVQPMMNCNADLGARFQAMQSSTINSVSDGVYS